MIDLTALLNRFTDLEEKVWELEEKVKELESKKKVTRFIKPSYVEIYEYLIYKKKVDGIAAQGIASDFLDHYNSNGWKVGKVPMQDWQAAINKWVKTTNKYATHQSTGNAGAKGSRGEQKIAAFKNFGLAGGESFY